MAWGGGDGGGGNYKLIIITTKNCLLWLCMKVDREQVLIVPVHLCSYIKIRSLFQPTHAYIIPHQLGLNLISSQPLLW